MHELLESVKLPRAADDRYPTSSPAGSGSGSRSPAPSPPAALLLCDEITSALDVSVQATVLELISELSVQTRTAVLWISHDLAVVRTIANRALVMRDGEVCEEGATDELFASAKHPYTRELLAAIPELPVQPPAANVA